MRKYIFISAGGFIGAILRYLCEKAPFQKNIWEFPLNTLLINITGCFILALFITLVATGFKVDNAIYSGITVGFLGAFTTFSTLCKEASELLTSGNPFIGIFYISMSILLGFLFSYFGVLKAKMLTDNKLTNT